MLILLLSADQIFHYSYWYLKCFEQREDLEIYEKSITHISQNELSKKVKTHTEIEMEKLRIHLSMDKDTKSKLSGIFNMESRFKSNLLLNDFIGKRYDGHSYINDESDKKETKSFFSIAFFIFLVVVISIFMSY